MSLLKLIKAGKPLPFSKTYTKDLRKVEFWRASYRVDSDYLESLDARGNNILMRFPCEDVSEYRYRLANTKPRNHVGNILKKQNGFVFKTEVERPESDVDYQNFISDCTLNCDDMDIYMQAALIAAQVDGYSITVVDNTNTSAQTKTLQQAKADNDRFFLRLISRDSVVNMVENDGYIIEIIIKYIDENGNSFARFYNSQIVLDMQLDSKDKVVAVGSPVNHGYSSIPVVKTHPMFPGSSQAESISELQQGLTQIISYLAVEMPTSIYTLHGFMGEPPTMDESGNVPKINLGSNRIAYISQVGQLTRIGADPNAATVLQTQIEKTEEAIYRTAGIVASSPMQSASPQSGLAKIYDQHDLSSILSILSAACERSENSIMKIVMETMKGLTPAKCIYDREFDIPDFMLELNELKAVLTVSELPPQVKQNHITTFISRNYNLTEDQIKSMKIVFNNDLPTATIGATDEVL